MPSRIRRCSMLIALVTLVFCIPIFALTSDYAYAGGSQDCSSEQTGSSFCCHCQDEGPAECAIYPYSGRVGCGDSWCSGISCILTP